MNWYYVSAGQQAGPVEEAQLEELFRSSQIQADTLVWREGMANWQAYREVKPVTTPTGAPPGPDSLPGPGSPPVIGVAPGTVFCSVCGKPYQQSEVINYEGKAICATCKPVFFQRLHEGAAAPALAGSPGITEAELLARDYEVDIGAAVSRGWEVFKADAGTIIGASVLVYLVLMAVNMIPYLSFLLALFFTGPLMAGLWFFYIKQVRGQPAGISDAFSGFGPRFWQYFLTNLIPNLVILAVVFCIGILVAIILVSAGGFGSGRRPSDFSMALVIPLVFAGLVAMGVIVYFQVCWLFALPLVADKKLEFWPALQLSRKMVMKHWWMTFLLTVVTGLIAMCGFLALCVGVIATGPIAFATLVSHYDRVFGELSSR